MTDTPLNEDVHIKAILLMIPFYAEKLAGLGVGLEINGHEVTKKILGTKENLQNIFSKPDTTVSFMSADKSKRVYYKLIADSDASVKPSEYTVGEDASAFVEVDASGKELLNPKTGKPNIIVSFPGLNNFTGGGLADSDFMHAAQDLKSSTSYEEKFQNDFEKRVGTELKKRGLTWADTEAVSHSLGDKGLAEYLARHPESKGMMIDGWSKQNAAIGAATRAVLKENADKSLSEAQFKGAFEAKLNQLSGRITEINSTEFLGMEWKHKPEIGGTSYEVSDASHTIKNFMQVTADRFVKQPEIPSMKALAVDALSSVKNVYAANYGHLVKVEASFLESISNQFNADGVVTKEEKAALSQLREKLSQTGIQVADMQAAQRLYLPADKTEKPANRR